MERNLKERIERDLKNAQKSIETKQKELLDKAKQQYPDDFYIFGIQSTLKAITEYVKEAKSLQALLDYIDEDENA